MSDERQVGITVPPWLLDSRGRLKRHPFEEAHDDPAPATRCWHCLRTREDKVHEERKDPT